MLEFLYNFLFGSMVGPDVQYAIAPIVAGALISSAGSIAGGLLGRKKKSPSIDVAGAQRLAKESSARQRDSIGQQFNDLQGQNKEWEAKRMGLSGSIQPQYEKIGKDLMTGYQQVGQAEQKNLEDILRTRQQQTARNIPLQQQLVREQLAASGGLRTGGAARSLQAPVLQAQTEQSDLASALSQQSQAAQTGRLERGTEAQAGLAKEALTTKLGIDEDTMNTLFETGRTDIIEKLGALRGVESDELKAMLSAMGINANIGLANTAVSNENRVMLGQTLGNVAGTIGGIVSSMPSANKWVNTGLGSGYTR